MNQPEMDRCPKCGTPYMGNLRPGESTASRYCYTCADAAGKITAQSAAQTPADDSLELQPLDDEPAARGRIPQIAPNQTGRPGAKAPPKKISSVIKNKTNEVFMPVRDDVAPEYATSVDKAASSARNRAIYAAPGIPQLAPTRADFAHKRKSPNLSSLIQAAAMLALGFGAWYFVFRNKHPEPGAQLAAAPKIVQAPTAVKPVVPATPAANAAAPKKIAVNPPLAKPATTPSLPASVNMAGAQTATGVAPDPIAPPAAISQTPTDPSAALARAPRRGKPALNVEDDDAPVVKSKTQIAKTPKDGDAPPVAEGDAAVPAQANAADAAAPENPDAPASDKKKLTVNDLLGKKDPDDDPKKSELEKRVNPFLQKTVAVTAIEPTAMPLDIERIGGNDKTMSEQLQALMPNWRVRDANFELSKINVAHQNRDKAVILNPMNDTLPAKLLATVEIPANFANRHPTLMFEISGTALNKSWLLSVRAMNVEMLSKQKVQLKRDAEWQNVAVDLSPLANKHFELQIEVYSSIKASGKAADKLKGELGCIRNVRIEWSGMKK